MSAFLICCGPEARTRLEALVPYLPAAVLAAGASTHQQYHGAYLSIALAGPDCGITEAHGVVLGLEGFLTQHAQRGAALRLALIAEFLQHGETCVKQWRGSFRAVIRHGNVTRIYTDQLASRALFCASDALGRLYSSHTAPLLAVLGRRTLDGANLLQFLHAGRFFAGASLFHEIRQLAPGTGQRVVNDAMVASDLHRPDVFTWYEYRLQNLPLSAEEILPELKARLDRAILQHWQRADAPALLLSGGVDSRYILNTLGQLLPRPKLSTLFTCLWGEPNPDSGSDAALAAREAARHGVAFAFYPMQVPLETLFDTMFAAQSGMTAHVFSHTDDFLWCRHLAQQGYGALLRGDECFGPNGAEVDSREQALARVGLGHLPVIGSASLAPSGGAVAPEAFDQDSSQWWREHALRIEALAQIADEPNDVRDLLYCRERLPALNAHLNSQRQPFVENFNPLLDPDILELVGQLPRHLRTDKRILRQCFQRYFPTDGFASSGNGFNWLRLWQQPELAAWVQRKLGQLPAPFDAAWWHQFGQVLSSDPAAPGSMEQARQIRAMQTASRAIVLGHWLQP